MRIVSEWKDYDNEVRKLQQQVESGEIKLNSPVIQVRDDKESSKDSHSEL